MCSFAVVASKVAGRTLENEQMEQTHVIGCLCTGTWGGVVVPVPNGFDEPRNGDELEVCGGVDAAERSGR